MTTPRKARGLGRLKEFSTCCHPLDGTGSFASYTGGFSSLLVNGSALASLGGGQWAYGLLTLTELWTGTTMSLSVTGTAVPEIDPASAGSVVSLLGGALALLERRLRRRGRAAVQAG